MSLKKLGYLLFGLFSLFYRLFPMNRHKAVFYMIHNDYKCGNLKYLYEELKKERPDDFFVFVSKSDFYKDKIRGFLYFYFILSFHFMTAGEIYLNDNFLPLAFIPLKKGVKVVQLWHGIGAFKRFGLSTEKNEEVRKLVIKGNKKVTHLFISSKEVLLFYEEAFQVSRERIYPAGLPVLDFYFDEEKKKKARENFFAQFVNLKNKKILLYTPTFRNTMEENKALLEFFSAQRLKEKLGDEWVILMRLHPALSGSNIISDLSEVVYDVSDYKDIKELYEVSNILVNDYSSTVIEFSLLGKPVIFFAPDLEKYDRGFYRDYKETVPGKIVRDTEELVRVIKEGEFDIEKMRRFLELHYDYYDSNNCKRIREILIKE